MTSNSQIQYFLHSLLYNMSNLVFFGQMLYDDNETSSFSKIGLWKRSNFHNFLTMNKESSLQIDK